MKYNISQEEIFKSQDYKCICNKVRDCLNCPLNDISILLKRDDLTCNELLEVYKMKYYSNNLK